MVYAQTSYFCFWFVFLQFNCAVWWIFVSDQKVLGTPALGQLLFAWLARLRVATAVACEGSDVTNADWQVGQQVAYFLVAPSFPAPWWRRCHPSRTLPDSWEWNELRNQSHILAVNVSSSRWLYCGLRSAAKPLQTHPPNPPQPLI